MDTKQTHGIPAPGTEGPHGTTEGRCNWCGQKLPDEAERVRQRNAREKQGANGPLGTTDGFCNWCGQDVPGN